MLVPDNNPVRRALDAMRQSRHRKAMAAGYEPAVAHALSELRMCGASGDAAGVKQWADEVHYLRTLGQHGFDVVHGTVDRPDFLDMVGVGVALYDQDAEDDEECDEEPYLAITVEDGNVWVWPEGDGWTDEQIATVLRRAADEWEADDQGEFL